MTTSSRNLSYISSKFDGSAATVGPTTFCVQYPTENDEKIERKSKKVAEPIYYVLSLPHRLRLILSITLYQMYNIILAIGIVTVLVP